MCSTMKRKKRGERKGREEEKKKKEERGVERSDLGFKKTLWLRKREPALGRGRNRRDADWRA